ncbi:hypothetical protein FRC08_004983 [Ceratobasidium sp. 394]|nr:hypothetical protein FRC08_004983 [Ceratobasidium sp. 394]
MGNQHYCVDGCTHEPFSRGKSLTIHQTKCEVYLAYERSLTAHLADSDDLEDVERSPKRRRTRSPSIEPGLEADFTQATPEPAPGLPAEPVHHVEVVPPRLTRAQARRLNTAFRVENDALPEAPAPLDPLPPPPTVNATTVPTLQTNSQAQRDARTQTRCHPPGRLPFRTEPDTFG